MAIDATQMLRQTFAARTEAMQVMQMATQDIAAKPAAAGSLMGVAFTVEADPMAELMDSMEELSFQFEEKEAKRTGERKLGQMQGSRTAMVEAIKTWMAMMPDMPGQEFMQKLLRQMRDMQKAGQLPDERETLKMLSRGSTDPSHQFAMLDILEKSVGTSKEDAALREALAKAKAALTQAKEPEIKAGLNLAQEINARASSPEEMQRLRDMYRGEVIGFTKPQDCFRSLLAQRGPGGIQDALNFLLASCGTDLKSASPSLPPEQLGQILTDLQCVQVLQTTMDKLAQLAARMGSQFGEQCLLNGEQMTGRVVDLTEQAFVTAHAIAQFVGECGVAKLLARMDFMRELTRLFRLLSPRLFAREDDRKRLVDAAQEHLDDLIMEEADEEDRKKENLSA